MPLTEEQEKLETKKRNEAHEQKQRHTEPENDYAYLDADECLSLNSHRAAIALENLHDVLKSDGMNFVYSAESESRVLRLIGELRQAFNETRMVPKASKREKQGNVIGWPGRGNVNPVILKGAR